MSDTEDVQAKRRMSDSSSASSGADDDSSLAKKPQELDNSGFRVDGEPLNKPRKVRPNLFTSFYLLTCFEIRSDTCKAQMENYSGHPAFLSSSFQRHSGTGLVHAKTKTAKPSGKLNIPRLCL